MGKSENTYEKKDDKFHLSRRGFLKGAVAAGAMATTYGCAKDDGGEIIYGGVLHCKRLFR